MSFLVKNREFFFILFLLYLMYPLRVTHALGIPRTYFLGKNWK